MDRKLCSLRDQNVVQLGRNPVTGSFVVMDAIVPQQVIGQNNDERVGSVVISDSINDVNRTDWLNVTARKCPCGNGTLEVYCLSNFSHCMVTANSSLNEMMTMMAREPLRMPQCVNITPTQNLVDTIFPIVWVWYVAMISGMVGTRKGRQVLHYIISSCCDPKWTDRLARRMLVHEPSRARRLIRRNWRQRRETVELYAEQMREDGIGVSTIAPQHTSIGLRTTLYRSEQDTNRGDTSNDTADHRDCSICFGPIENNDRVGALRCNHLFHSDCLKTWLVRRQVCPLCLREDIVEPIFTNHTSECCSDGELLDPRNPSRDLLVDL